VDVDRKKQEAVFIKAYDSYSDALFRFCYFKVYDRELAKDMVQETFTRTWTELTKGKELVNPRAFLYTVAGNIVKDFWKKKKALPMGQLEDDEDGWIFDIKDESPGQEIEAEVKRAVRMFQKLSDPDREVLTLRFIDGLPPKEIAEALGERENTVSVRLSRAVERLREIIGD
jgi:RNA polymerase sigma factor (sigma-70 family)